MVELKCRIKAATLIESLIAMIVIVICIGIAAMIYSNVLTSDKQLLHLKASLYIKNEAIRTKKEKSFLDIEKPVGEWVLQKTVKPFPRTENLFQLTLIISDSKGEILAEQHELVVVE